MKPLMTKREFIEAVENGCGTGWSKRISELVLPIVQSAGLEFVPAEPTLPKLRISHTGATTGRLKADDGDDEPLRDLTIEELHEVILRCDAYPEQTHALNRAFGYHAEADTLRRELLDFKREWVRRFGFLARKNPPDSLESIDEVACVINGPKAESIRDLGYRDGYRQGIIDACQRLRQMIEPDGE